MDYELACNFRKCRKQLRNFAWVTSCSHIFCDDDGTREFNDNKNTSCPACSGNLSAKYDVLRVDLHPSEQYKSMVLAGQKPETIMDIGSRAISFWTYQALQERTYQEYVATKARENKAQLEQYYQQLITRIQAELSNLKNEVSARDKELDSLKKVYADVQGKMMEKTRQYQKLQSMYDSLRRKCISPNSFGGAGDGSSSSHSTSRSSRQHELSFQMSTDFPMSYGVGAHANSSKQVMHSPALGRDFVLRPAPTPTPVDRERVTHRVSTPRGHGSSRNPSHIEW